MKTRAGLARLVLLIAGLALAAGCTLPNRDNLRDPQNRPNAQLVVNTLRPVNGLAEADLVLDGVLPFQAIADSSGPTDNYFVADAQLTTDPRDPTGASLTFEFKLGTGEFAQPDPANAVCPSAVIGSAGTPSMRCRVFRASEIAAVLDGGKPARNEKITVTLRVTNALGAVSEVEADLQVLDYPPIADAGADYVVPRRGCSGCTYAVTLDGARSSDRDPAPGDEAEPIRSFCWEEIPRAGSACLDASSYVASVPSPDDACPAAPILPAGTDPACLHPGKRLVATVPAGVVAGVAPSRRFRLWTKDRYSWGAPDAMDVRINGAALWFDRDAPPLAERFSEGFYVIAPERFSQQSSTRQPVVAAGPDSGISYVLSGVRNADVMFIDQVDAAGTISPFANNQSNVGHELLPMIAASNGHVLWSAFTTDDTLQPDDIYMVATTGGTLTSGLPLEVVALGDCPNLGNGTPNASCYIGKLDFLAVTADERAIGARLGDTRLRRFAPDAGHEVVVDSSGFPAFGSIQGIEVADDGRVFVADAAETDPAPRVRIFAPGVAETTLSGLGHVDALRYDATRDELWVNAGDTGLWVIPLLEPTHRLRVSDPLGPATAVRLIGDGRAWVTLRFATTALFVDPASSKPPDSFPLDGLPTGTSGVFPDGSLLASIATVDTFLGAAVRLPALGERVGGTNPLLGSLTDLSSDPLSGGAWFSFANPGRIIRAESDGKPLPATGATSFDIGGITRTLVRPFHLAADRATDSLWIVDVADPTSNQPVSRWFLTRRPAAGDFQPPAGLAYYALGEATGAPGELVARVAPAGGITTPAAWALAIPAFGGAPSAVYVRQSGTTLARKDIFAGSFPVGPTVSNTGTAWFASCSVSGFAYDFNNGCFSPTASDVVDAHLWYAAANTTTVTEWVPPAPASLLGFNFMPLDISFDPERNAVWLVTVQNQLAYVVWRFRCRTGGRLETCSAANVESATFDPGKSLPTTFTFNDYYKRLDFLQKGTRVLGADSGTGGAYFLDPVTHVISRLEVQNGVVVRLGYFDGDSMTREAIDR